MPTPEEIQNAIARNVRRCRTARELSLDELAARSTVSRAMIVQIEQGRTNPSINTLCLLAEALGEPVPALIDVVDPSPVRVIPASETVDLWKGRKGSRATVLAGAAASGPVELWKWKLAPGDPYETSAHAAGTREILYVIKGELSLTVGDVEHRATAGETLVFDANTTHRYAAGRSGAELLMVVLEPPTPLRKPGTRRAT